MKALLDILNGMTEDNCEQTYHDFYRVCQAGIIDADQVVDRIWFISRDSADLVIESYCFLLLGAIVHSDV